MNGIIHAIDTEMEGGRKNLSDRASTFASHCPTEKHSLFGENTGTQVATRASTVQSSETNRKSCHLTLSERLTPLLISAGLAKGTTLTLGKRLLSRGIRAGVSFAPDGSVVDIQNGTSYLF